jgi:hypothetical protein
MMALSLHQPWCSIMAAGRKPVENRSWPPPPGLVGNDFALHAALTWDNEGANWISERFGKEVYADLAFRTHGAILCVVRLDSVCTASDSPWFFGPFGWNVSNVRALTQPVACKGMQKLWSIPTVIERQVLAQLGST